MASTFEIDIGGFTGMVQDLARISGKTYEQALIQQAGAVLKRCARQQSAAKAGVITKSLKSSKSNVKFDGGEVIAIWRGGSDEMFLERSDFQPDSAGAKKKTKPPKVLRGGMTWHNMTTGRHWSAERWARYKAFEAQEKKQKAIQLRRALAARGLAKQSWQQIGDDLGLSLGIPGYAQAAKPSNQKSYKNGTAMRQTEGDALYIEISNSNPLVAGGFNKRRTASPVGIAILQGAIHARRNAFYADLERGVFDDIKLRATRYPGIFTN